MENLEREMSGNSPPSVVFILFSDAMNHMAKRVFRALIKSSLRPYLLYELSIDQLSQAEGGVGLQNLELNPQVRTRLLVNLSFSFTFTGIQ